jgi:acetylornithine deacetylase/succinyl-diaminopimelate desuccinylase-like protein
MRSVGMAAAVAALLLCPFAAPAAPPAPAATPRSPAQWDRLAHDIFAELVAIDSTHESGSAQAAEALAARFRAAGFPGSDIAIVGPQPDKMNIVVRLHARAAAGRKPVLFNGHLDVVEASRASWSVEPFRLTEQDGYFYGRGTEDMKDEVAILATNLIRLHAEGFRPARDVVLAFGTDEEAGGTRNGAEWLLARHRELVDAGLVINADVIGGCRSVHGERVRNELETAEKVYATYTLTTRGQGGHSSMPTRDNAIYRLAAALARVDAYRFPLRLSDTTRRYLEALARRATGQRAADLAAVLATPPDPGAEERLRDVPFINAALRTTCTATQLQAGQSESALPMRAQATLQCRLLPDEKPDEWVATLRRVVADPKVEVEVAFAPVESPATPLDPAVLAVVERVTGEMWPGVPVVPMMSVLASDSVYFRGAGLPTYGVSGVCVEEDDMRLHGRDERIGVRQFYEGLEFGYRLIRALAGGS